MIATAAHLNGFGLFLDIIGIVVLFTFAFPPPAFEGGSYGIGLEDGTRLSDGLTVKEHKERDDSKKRRYSFLSLMGLCLIVIGFCCQFVSMWLPD